MSGRREAGTQPDFPKRPGLEMLPLIFISARTDDYEYAGQIYRFLKSAGLSVFFSHESLPELASSDYRKQIDDALDRAEHMIVVTSSRANVDSSWVEAEWGLFINEKRSGRKSGNLITVIVGDLKPGDLPPSLRYYEVIPFGPESLPRILRYVKQREDQLPSPSLQTETKAVLVARKPPEATEKKESARVVQVARPNEQHKQQVQQAAVLKPGDLNKRGGRLRFLKWLAPLMAIVVVAAFGYSFCGPTPVQRTTTPTQSDNNPTSTSATRTAAETSINSTLSLSNVDGHIQATGVVPDENTKQEILFCLSATAPAGGGGHSEHITVDPRAKPPEWMREQGANLCGALSDLNDAPGATIKFDGQSIEVGGLSGSALADLKDKMRSHFGGGFSVTGAGP